MLTFKPKKDGMICLAACIVPFICEPLTCQRTCESAERYSHLEGLELADPISSDDVLQVDMFVGSDHHWWIVNGGSAYSAYCKDWSKYQSYSLAMVQWLRTNCAEGWLKRNQTHKRSYPLLASPRQDNPTTKLRIVYYASAKTIDPSMNECLYAGPSFG